ncbi:hypothetical protein K432DRAFT_384816 [Lepidopterella palustris CBS 459.81]|uniref:Uncharacterized protein n=1 Tax=Lepidopterella palustris CBS 459.81 TaxID=1314670 RepID=A0A8E2E4J3_9PEZI|nr:hypothetical protein K432DRAFT_384816 [Lepidopterella palustris CBS 459.81]
MTTVSVNTSTTQASPSSSGVSKEALAGIVIAEIVVVGIALGIVAYSCRRNWEKKQTPVKTSPTKDSSGRRTSTSGGKTNN